MEEKEIWKDVVGFSGYQVSNLGRVMNLKKNKILRESKSSKGYVLVSLTKNGISRYYRVHRLVAESFIGKIASGYEIDHINCVRDDNRVENLRIVTHKENCNNPLTVINLSGRVGELNPMFNKHLSETTKKKISESLSKSNKHPWRGKHFSKEHREKISQSRKGQLLSEETKLKKSKGIVQYSLDGQFIREWVSATQVERELGFSKSNVCNCCRGKLPKAYGFIWKYKE